MNTSERRVLNLEDVGLPSVPMLGYCNYRNPRPDVPNIGTPAALAHFCVRNTLSFGFNGRTYRLAPGEVFVNLPDERHTVSAHLQGACILYWMILRVDDKAGPFLQQPPQEAAALRQERVEHSLPPLPVPSTALFQSPTCCTLVPDTHLRTLRVRLRCWFPLMEVLTAANAHTVPPGEERLEAQMREMQAHPENEFVVEELARQSRHGAHSLHHALPWVGRTSAAPVPARLPHAGRPGAPAGEQHLGHRDRPAPRFLFLAALREPLQAAYRRHPAGLPPRRHRPSPPATWSIARAACHDHTPSCASGYGTGPALPDAADGFKPAPAGSGPIPRQRAHGNTVGADDSQS